MEVLLLVLGILLLITVNVIGIMILVQLKALVTRTNNEFLAAERDTFLIENMSHALGQLVPPPVRKDG